MCAARLTACDRLAAMQVYWCYTDQRYWIYLRRIWIDKLLIKEVNLESAPFKNPIPMIGILTS